MALRESLIAESETGKVTMVEWNNAWMKLTRSMDIYRTISEIESTGNKAEYHSANVTDSVAIRSAVGGQGRNRNRARSRTRRIQARS